MRQYIQDFICKEAANQHYTKGFVTIVDILTVLVQVRMEVACWLAYAYTKYVWWVLIRTSTVIYLNHSPILLGTFAEYREWLHQNSRGQTTSSQAPTSDGSVIMSKYQALDS